jgi:hypothetical protein
MLESGLVPMYAGPDEWLPHHASATLSIPVASPNAAAVDNSVGLPHG